MDSDEALCRMVAATNNGFPGGKVTKAELLSWLVLHFEKNTFAAVREDLRKAYFDKIAYLSSVVDELKKAQRDGVSGPDLESLLAPLSNKSVPGSK